MSEENVELEADEFNLSREGTGWDLLFDYEGHLQKCTLYDRGGNRIYDCEMRNATTHPGQYGHNGPCPAGDFVLGAPLRVEKPSMGVWFIPLFDLDESGPLHKEGRHGIGIHGGGSGLEEPFAAEQGWVKTHGCFRVQNEALNQIASLLLEHQRQGGQALIHVKPS